MPRGDVALGQCQDAEMGSPTAVRHLIGLLLGTEDDWPSAFEALVRRLGPVTDSSGTRHSFDVERITIEPFDLRDRPRYELVIDRLAYWYLLNSPFTFQSMEKHAAYCAMIRLGLKVPNTTLVPYKNPVDHDKYVYTAERYNKAFDLDAVAERVGYPLFMKPYDGGAWRGVSRIRNPAELHRAYDESGEMLMHLQAAVEGYDVFARSLSIGAETMVMRFRPELPMHDRYAVDHSLLSPELGNEVVTISRLVNAFFRWEFNSCETLVRGQDAHPIDYANACPDVAVTSLHYYFPWAMKALIKWSVFCLATGRRARIDLDTRRYFEIADRDDLSYAEKLHAYRVLADEYFETERYGDFCASRLPDLDRVVVEWIAGPDFDRLLAETVRSTYPPAEHERFLAHFRGLLGAWVADEEQRLSAGLDSSPAVG